LRSPVYHNYLDTHVLSCCSAVLLGIVISAGAVVGAVGVGVVGIAGIAVLCVG
jgi:hypothetical protein